MITSRLPVLMRLHGSAGRNLFQNRIQKNLENPKRNHGAKWFYRKNPDENPKYLKAAELGGAAMWWWIIWHLVTDYEELLPRRAPDPSTWTDEELGIPPE